MLSEFSRNNPYIGPRAYQTGEKLYGRDREVRQLLDLLIAERIVLLHSPSGAGKSSLVQAGLIPCLAEEGFHVLPVIRVNLDPALGFSINRYVFSTLLSFEEGRPESEWRSPQQLAKMTLLEYLKDEAFTSEDQNSVLIFDQFEEILTLSPSDRAGKGEFFSQLGQALRSRQLWALFSMREDYTAALDPYLRPIPTRLANTFRLDLLGVDAALNAIQHPAHQGGVDFITSAASRLVDDLRRIQVQQPDGTMQQQLGLYVEPVQLQVVCYRLWENLAPDQTSITEADLAATGDVDQSLAEYYASQVIGTARETGVSERAIRDWFEHQLITEGGIRSQVLMGHGQSEGLDNRAIRRLENAHLVRAEKRGGATWFELAHDRLIQPVRTDNTAWFQANLSLLQRQAALWEKDFHRPTLLLRGAALQEAEAWAGSHADELTAIEREFLQACQAGQLKEEQELVQQTRLRAARQTARLRSNALRGLLGGALGFTLVFWLTFAPQAIQDLGRMPTILVPIMITGTLNSAAAGMIAGLLLSQLSTLALAGPGNRQRWLPWVVSGLAGASQFSLALLALSYLTQGSSDSLLNVVRNILLVAVQGGLWGLVAGLGMVWVLHHPHRTWQTVPIVALACGVVLVMSEAAFGQAFKSVTSLWQIALAGMIMPLMIMASTVLGRPVSQEEA